MSAKLKAVYNSTTGVMNAAFKRLMFLALMAGVVVATVTTLIVIFAYKIIT